MYEKIRVDSPYIQFIWHAQPDKSGDYLHAASEYWSFFFKSVHGKSEVFLSGPVSAPRTLSYEAGGDYWGIVCKSHVFIPSLAKKDILNINVPLPLAGPQSFLLDSIKLSIPTPKTAKEFVDSLVSRGVLIASPIVEKALAGASWMSNRSLQRHVVRATGLSRRKVLQIHQARKAYALLQQGVSIADVVVRLGYADQSHLTKSLRLLAGQTPAQILRAR